MADDACLNVATTAWQAKAVERVLRETPGVKRVEGGIDGRLVVAIERESKASVMERIGHVDGIIHVDLVE